MYLGAEPGVCSSHCSKQHRALPSKTENPHDPSLQAEPAFRINSTPAAWAQSIHYKLDGLTEAKDRTQKLQIQIIKSHGNLDKEFIPCPLSHIPLRLSQLSAGGA